MKTLGERIKMIRGEMSQRQFAQLLGIPATTLANYERNKSELNFATIKLFITKFQVATDWLLFGQGPMSAKKRSESEELGGAGGQSSSCERCVRLEKDLEKEKEERRELAAENRRLWKENAALREENATLRERQRKEDQASLFDERKDSRHNDEPLQTRPFSRG